MDRHTCKLCFRRFSNGRALGGHMRSHVASAAMKPQLRDSSVSLSSSSSASHAEHEAAEHEPGVAEGPAAEAGAEAAGAMVAGGEEAAGAGDAKQLAYYGLRENPRKSCRLADPEFAFSSTFAAAEYAAGSSVILQDRESETESSKPPSLRRRSSRRRRGPATQPLLPPPPKLEPSFEPEPVSSVSDATPEEDVARCLMMLSRDVWTTDSSTAAGKRKRPRRGEVAAGEEEDDDDEEEGEQQEGEEHSEGSEKGRPAIVRSRRGGRRRYQCGTCGKVFRSYQALGGHRASHKSARACAAVPPIPAPVSFDEERDGYDHEHVYHPGHQIQDADSEVNVAPSPASADRRVHECPVCFRVFGSGQALGGHKRSHLAYSSTLLLSSTAAAARDVAATTSATTAGDAAATAIAGGGSGVVGCSPVGANFTKKFAGESLIDLNLPAPMEEEAEMSAVFDAEQ